MELTKEARETYRRLFGAEPQPDKRVTRNCWQYCKMRYSARCFPPVRSTTSSESL